MENNHHTKNKIANTLSTELFLKNAPLNLKSWSLGLRLLWVFKNKESLEKGSRQLKADFSNLF
ncbi:hypothetical protein HPSH417_02550 [Helicobacter pylori Shi417]|nr:hypothetical protein HPSH417_02550 [Helicobacter pylori Shi417]